MQLIGFLYALLGAMLHKLLFLQGGIGGWLGVGVDDWHSSWILSRLSRSFLGQPARTLVHPVPCH